MEYIHCNVNNLSHVNFKVIKHIGKGSFSNVYLCKEDNINLSLNLSSLFIDKNKQRNFFIIKEINLDNLVIKHMQKIKKEPFVKKQTISIQNTNNVAITPYSYSYNKNNIILNSEEDYYYKKYKNLIESEIEILKRIEHENIIKFYSSNVSLNIYIIKIEYCLYSDLYNILKEQTFKDNILFKDRNIFNGFNNSFIINFINDISKAIEYIHKLNIIHRDIKLHNILCSINKKSNKIIFKLSDFGFACLDHFEEPSILSKSLNESYIDFSATSLNKKYYKLCGTPYYMAPEIILNIENFEQLNYSPLSHNKNNNYSKIYDGKIDLWSFGISLFELIFNILPFNNCIIDSIHDLIIYFSKSNINKNQTHIFKNIDKEYYGKIDNNINLLLKRLLTIDSTKRLLQNELLNFNENLEYHNRQLSLVPKYELITDNWEKINPTEILSLQSNIPEFVNSWDKINKASSLIMKVSVDNDFMKWLLTKKN